MAKKKTHDETSSETPLAEPRGLSPAGKGAWKALDASAAMLAGLAAPRLAQIIWRTATGKSAPRSTRSTEISMAEALLWAAVAGALAQVLRTAAARAAAAYWERSTGATPPSAKSKKK